MLGTVTMKDDKKIEDLGVQKKACEEMFEKTGNKKWLQQVRAFEELIEEERNKG